MATLATVAGAGAFVAALTSPGQARPESRGGPGPSGATRLVGAMSCSARGCHGAVGPVAPARGDVFVEDGAATTWRTFDRHARAYAVLLEPRSARIAKGLRESLGGKAAHESRACLACHATAPTDEAGRPGARAAEGVSCESCHGPARDWLDDHLSPAWRKDPEARGRGGMVELGGAVGRASSCVDCHVGNRSRGMEVNHDLIAAGHPRLNFEYAGYLASYPKHWREKSGFAEDEAGHWAVGQAITARAALTLLEDRAKAARDAKADAPAWAAPWPEFSESECFACHHSLEKPSWSPDRGALGVPRGRLPWGTWHLAMLPELGQVRPGWGSDESRPPWDALRAEMSRGEPDPKAVADLASQAVARVDAWLASPAGPRPTAGQVDGLIGKLAEGWPGRAETWDQSAQRLLAISAMARSGQALGLPAGRLSEVRATLEAAGRRLGFPAGSDSPKGGRPAAAPGP